MGYSSSSVSCAERFKWKALSTSGANTFSLIPIKDFDGSPNTTAIGTTSRPRFTAQGLLWTAMSTTWARLSVISNRQTQRLSTLWVNFTGGLRPEKRAGCTTMLRRRTFLAQRQPAKKSRGRWANTSNPMRSCRRSNWKGRCLRGSVLARISLHRIGARWRKSSDWPWPSSQLRS